MPSNLETVCSQASTGSLYRPAGIGNVRVRLGNVRLGLGNVRVRYAMTQFRNAKDVSLSLAVWDQICGASDEEICFPVGTKIDHNKEYPILSQLLTDCSFDMNGSWLMKIFDKYIIPQTRKYRTCCYKRYLIEERHCC